MIGDINHSPTISGELKQCNIYFWDLFYLTSFNFCYGLICGTIGLFLLPAEAQQLYPDSDSITLAISLIIVGISQLICPLAGMLSDTDLGDTAFNRRYPYIVGGASIACTSIIAMYICSILQFGWFYYAALFFGMIALNVLYSVQCSLVPDFIAAEHHGKASGMVAINTVVGSGLGFALIVTLHDKDYHILYGLYLVLIFATVGAALFKANMLQDYIDSLRLRTPLISQQQTTPNTPASISHHAQLLVNSQSVDCCKLSKSLSGMHSRTILAQTELPAIETISRTIKWKHIAACYTIDTSKSCDFLWVFIGRTCYYTAVSCQAYMLFYLRDVIGSRDQSTRQTQIGIMSLCAQGTAACLAYPIGKLVDSAKVDKTTMIYAACGMMAGAYITYIFAPLFGNNAFLFLVCASIVYGIGNGCFLATDYALALSTAPCKKHISQALGLWGVSAFVGLAIGPIIWGGLLHFFGSSISLPPGEYIYSGYISILSGGVVVTILAGFVMHLVKTPSINKMNDV